MWITPWPNKFPKGFTGENEDCPEFGPVEVKQALEARYSTDAHFVPYRVQFNGDPVEENPRINKPGLDAILKQGGGLLFDVLPQDIDHPKAHSGEIKEAPADWIEKQIARARTLDDGLDCLGWYATRGGFRLLWGLEEPVDHVSYLILQRAIRRRLQAVGVIADELDDFGRCYRLPRVIRDGSGNRENRPIDLDKLEPLDLGYLLTEAEDDPQSVFSDINKSRERFQLPDEIKHNRNIVLTQYGGQLRGQGYEEAEILEALEKVVDSGRCCGWEPEPNELEGIAKSVSKYEKGVNSAVQLESGSEAYLSTVLHDRLGHIVYDRSTLHQYQADHGYWEAIDHYQLKKMAMGFDGEVYTSGQYKDGSYKYAKVRISNHMAEGIAKCLGAHASETGFFDQAPMGIPFKNGFLTVKEGAIVVEPLSPDHRSLVAAKWDYVPGQLPGLFIKVLKDMLLDDDAKDAECKMQLLREFVGICLLGHATQYQTALILLGDGANGKSTFLEIVSALFKGLRIESVSPQDMGREYYKAQLQGARINLVSEMPEAAILASESVKAFIAGDPVMGRDPSGKPFLFTPSAGHIVAANRLPAVRDFSTGFWRRWVVCEFNRVFTAEEADRDIAQKVIKSELGAIAGWCVDGALNLIQRGHYHRPKSSNDAVNQWRVDVDSVARFLQEMTVPTKDSNGKGTGARELYNRYSNYTRRDNGQPVNIRNFSHRLEKHKVYKRRFSAGYFYNVEVLKTIRPVPNASEDAANGGQNA